MTAKTMVLVQNEWMRLYIEEPETFRNMQSCVNEFVSHDNLDIEPSYGTECTDFMFYLAEKMGL